MLTPKQARFVAEYLKDLNATQAAIRAGYSKKVAAAQGHENLRKPEIQSAISVKQALHLTKADLTAVRTLEEMRRLAFSDIRGLFDAAGNLRPIHTLTAEQAACISSIEVIIKNAAAGDGVTDTVHKVRIWDKTKALDMLGKHFGLLIDKLEHVGELTIKWQD